MPFWLTTLSSMMKLIPFPSGKLFSPKSPVAFFTSASAHARVGSSFGKSRKAGCFSTSWNELTGSMLHCSPPARLPKNTLRRMT